MGVEVDAERRAGLRFRFLDGAAELPAGQWDRLARRGFHLHCLFVAAEAGGSLRAHHLLARDDEGCRALFPAYLQESALHGDLHDRWLGPLASLAARAGLSLRPTLAVTPPLVTASDPLGDPAALDEQALESVFDLLEQRARAERARAIVWPALGPGHETLVRHALRRGYLAFYAGCRAILQVGWTSFEEYIASRTKNVRKTIRADLRLLREAGTSWTRTCDFAAEAEEMERLYRDFFLRRNGRPAELAEGFFARLASARHPGVTAQAGRQGRRLMTVSLNFTTRSMLDGSFGGYAEGVPGGAVYVNDAIYQPILVTAGSTVTALDLGPAALYAKVVRGAVLRPQMTLALGLTRTTGLALRALGPASAARTHAKERSALGGLADRLPPHRRPLIGDGS
jgi:predicted N-acyltransferase